MARRKPNTAKKPAPKPAPKKPSPEPEPPEVEKENVPTRESPTFALDTDDSGDEEEADKGVDIVCGDKQPESQLTLPAFSPHHIAPSASQNGTLATNNGPRPFLLHDPRQLNYDAWQHVHQAQFPRLMAQEQYRAQLAQAQVQQQQQVHQVQPAPVPVPEAPAAKNTNTKKKGGGNMKYSRDELEILLEALEEVMPIGKVDWEKVESMYNLQVPEERERTLLKLRNQYNTLCSKRPPTGDPNCPPEVKRAKRISYKIKIKPAVRLWPLTHHPVLSQRRPKMLQETKKTAAAAAAAAISAPTYKKVNKSRSDTSDLLEAFLATERIQAKREQRRDDRSRAELKQWMQLAVNGANAFALAIAGKKVPDHATQDEKKARKRKEKYAKVLSHRKKRVAKNACSKVLEYDSHSDNELTHDLYGEPILTHHKPILTHCDYGEEEDEEDEEDEDNGGGKPAAK